MIKQYRKNMPNFGGVHMNSYTISEQISYFALNLQYDDIPNTVIEAAKKHILDTIGVALLSVKTSPTSPIIRKVVCEAGSAAECTLWGSADKVCLADAVLCNSTVIHGLDFDDTHTGAITHPSTSVLSTAFAVGEKLNKSGAEILTAAIAGYETIVRMGLAADGGFHDAGFHPSGILAPFACVLTAGKLMGCDMNILVNALGIAGSQAGTIMEFLHDGSWVKMVHPGWGALCAIYAVKMAAAGLTGPKTVFEGKYGVFPVHLGSVKSLPQRMATLGKEWLTPDIAFKLYPCCHHNHSFIDIMQKLMREQHFTADDIEAIEARGTHMCASQICDPKEVKIRPQTEYMMKFSLYYIIAMTALHGKITAEEINLKYAHDPKVLDMIDRITFITDESIAVKGHMPAKLKITLKDKRVFSGEQQYEKSAGENPITLNDILDKYYGCVSGCLSKDKADAIADKALQFEKLENISGLLKDMTP